MSASETELALLERRLTELCEADRFDEAEAEKGRAVPWLKALLRQRDPVGRRVLDLFSALAGDAESFDALSHLLDGLVDEGVITPSEAADWVRTSPANRWS
jgi:hypothetical protein